MRRRYQTAAPVAPATPRVRARPRSNWAWVLVPTLRAWIECTMGSSDIKPPFTRETALEKVKAAQDAWNSRDPERVAQAYTEDSQWRNRDEFFRGREAIVAFLRRKWAKELDYRLMKELWCFQGNRISVRFEYEWRRADTGCWYRTHGNEHWEFDDGGLMRQRDMSANDIPIDEADRRYRG